MILLTSVHFKGMQFNPSIPTQTHLLDTGHGTRRREDEGKEGKGAAAPQGGSEWEVPNQLGAPIDSGQVQRASWSA